MRARSGQGLDELRTMLAPARNLRARAYRAEIQVALGVEPPADYQRLMTRSAAAVGYIDQHLYLLAPSRPNPYYDLAEAAAERLEALEYLWKRGERRPAELAGTGARLYPWATNDNGEVLYWLIRPGTRPDEGIVMLNEARGPRGSALRPAASNSSQASRAAASPRPSSPVDTPPSRRRSPASPNRKRDR